MNPKDSNIKWVATPVKIEANINWVGVKPTVETDPVYYSPFFKEGSVVHISGTANVPEGSFMVLPPEKIEQVVATVKQEVSEGLKGFVSEPLPWSYKEAMLNHPVIPIAEPEYGLSPLSVTVKNSQAKHGPNWCEHCKVNHWKKTKCPYKSNEGQPKTEEPKVPETIQPPEDVKFWHQQNWTQDLFGKSNVPGPPDMPYAWTQGGGGQQLIAELSHGAQSAEELSTIFGDKAILSALLTDGVTKGFFKKTKDGLIALDAEGYAEKKPPKKTKEPFSSYTPLAKEQPAPEPLQPQKIDVKNHPDYASSWTPGFKLLQMLNSPLCPTNFSNKLSLIKAYREYCTEYFGDTPGLKEAKDVVEKAIDDGIFMGGEKYGAYAGTLNVSKSDLPDPGKPKPSITKQVAGATKQLGWNPNGKGQKLLQAISEDISTVEGLVNQIPNLTKGLASHLIDQAMSAGWVKRDNPGEKPGKYSFIKKEEQKQEAPKEQPKAKLPEIKLLDPKSVPSWNSLDDFEPDEWPQASDLQIMGSAANLGGSKTKYFVGDGTGDVYIFKPEQQPGDKLKTKASQVVYDLGKKLLGYDNVIPVTETTVNDPNGKQLGSIQPYLKGSHPPGTNYLTPKQMYQLQQEQVLDWVTGQTDTKSQNFIQVGDKILGVDKEQAFKFLGQDQLDNPKSIYKSLYSNADNLAQAQLAFDTIKKVEAISDEEWLKLTAPYTGNAEAWENKILDRKHSCREDFEKYFTSLMGHEFKFQEPKPETSKPPPNPILETPTKVEGPNDQPKVTPSTKLPDISTLSFAGSAKDLGGQKDKFYMKDKQGNKFLFKPSPDSFRAAAQQSVANLTSLFIPEGEFIPVKATNSAKGLGSLQPYLSNVVSDLSQKDLISLNKSQLDDILRERLVDWVLSNHDTHSKNMVVLDDGSILGVDKEQAFKHIGDDKLSLDYHPNKKFDEQPPVYNQLFDLYTKKKVDLDLNSISSYIKKIEDVPDESWKKLAEPYVDAFVTEGTQETKASLMKKILDRKHSVKTDFEKFFTELKKKREGKKSEGFTFKASSIAQFSHMVMTSSQLDISLGTSTQ